MGQYRHTINRIQNGYKQCDELLAFIKDRAIIEESYCKSLREWTAKHQKVEKFNFKIHFIFLYGPIKCKPNSCKCHLGCVSELVVAYF